MFSFRQECSLFGPGFRSQPDLLRDKMRDVLQILEMETLAAGHVVHVTAPASQLAFSIHRLRPNTNDKGMYIVFQALSLY